MEATEPPSADQSQPGPLGSDPQALREDLAREYYAILDVVSDFDQRFLTVKSWSVTLSLVSLGLGFAQEHAAYFALAAFSGLCFWVLEAVSKRHQLRYYGRIRDIEVAASLLNSVALPGLGMMSAPRIDMAWCFDGFGVHPVTGAPIPATDRHGRPVTDWRTDPVWRRSPQEVHWLLRRPFLLPHVLLPHALAVAAGLLLCLGVALGVTPLADLPW